MPKYSYFRNLKPNEEGAVLIYSQRQQEIRNRMGAPRLTFDTGNGEPQPYTNLIPKGRDMSDVAKRFPDHKVVGTVTSNTTISSSPAPAGSHYSSHRWDP